MHMKIRPIVLSLLLVPGASFAAADTNKYIRCGASPRGAQALVLAGKVRALLEGRYNVSFDDVRFSTDKRPYKTQVAIHFRHAAAIE